jgi:hypothetical protein
MNLYLQFGHGMMSIAEELIGKWNGGGVIISPRDLDEAQLNKVSAMTLKCGGEVLIDPQCYIHAADHPRLTGYPYWQEFKKHSTADLASSGNQSVLDLLWKLNSAAKASALILPGLYAEKLSDEWWLFHEEQLKSAVKTLGDTELIPTIAISSAVVEDENSVDEICEHVKKWPTKRIYLVAESTTSYLSDSPTWLAGILTLSGGLKLAGKSILVGYGNHQLLALNCVGVDSMASGTWLNVRAFPPDKFKVSEEDEISRRAKGGWYYCPQALSEYKMPFLDVAKKQHVLNDMYPNPDSGYAGPLFTGIEPSLVNWGERNAFCHYLCALRAQASRPKEKTFDAMIKAHVDPAPQYWTPV